MDRDPLLGAKSSIYSPYYFHRNRYHSCQIWLKSVAMRRGCHGQSPVARGQGHRYIALITSTGLDINYTKFG